MGKGAGRLPCPNPLLVRSRRGCRNNVFGELRRRSAVHHGGGVLRTDTVGAKMVLHQVYNCVIRVLIRPVALPLEKRGKSGHWLGPGLYKSAHRIVVSELADISAAILGHINVVA